ncbi:hypothetical protein P691DRAFT_764816 [Macrolepiota fuliginosa MF-IS2]|uniref:Uncharacterized protein n=1 Tax=Macrolepiota fuliginosa MF-IS2 TaxID=1400762 RepID=A0A9P5X135_9AGAR|nr:hypothetical protein P691DRAFT_764816 [Macrolepiota fuliginosa MF-IS2]
MLPERPPSRSERLLRSTLDRNAPAQPQSPRIHRRRHSHVPGATLTQRGSTSNGTCTPADDDDQLCRAAFLYRTAATASSPIRPHPNLSPSPSRPASPSFRPASPSPSSPRQPLQRSTVSDGNLSLQRHNSIPARKKPASLPAEPLPLTPHEQVLRARLERVLISGRVVDDKERSRERRRSRDRSFTRKDGDGAGWTWSERDNHSMLASTPPKSSTSGSSDHSNYLYQNYQHQTHHRSRSKTDPVPPPSTTPATPRRATTATQPVSSYYSKSPSLAPRHPQHPARNNSNSSSAVTTPPLTADASPVLGQDGDLMQQQSQQSIDPDDVRLLTPPPTPPLVGTATPGSTKRPGVAMYRTRTRDSTEYASSPYMYPCKRREIDGSVERLDLSLGSGAPAVGPAARCSTFNARKASERCRMMEGYVSFASVEGLGMPPDGVDDDEKEDEGKEDEKRGRGISVIGGWARRLFVGIGNQNGASATNSNHHHPRNSTTVS